MTTAEFGGKEEEAAASRQTISTEASIILLHIIKNHT
jgi:hypothetical protein